MVPLGLPIQQSLLVPSGHSKRLEVEIMSLMTLVWMALNLALALAETFIPAELPVDGWSGVVVPEYTTWLKCSIACQVVFPSCKIFAFDTQCRHGTALEGTSNTLENVYIEAAEWAKMEVRKRNGLAWSPFMSFEPHLVGQKLFVDVNEAKSVPDSFMFCLGLGGNLAFSLNEERVWKYFEANTEPGRDWWVGLTYSPDSNSTNCTNEECNGNWIWIKGLQVASEFKHEPFMSCSMQAEAVDSGLMILGMKSICSSENQLTLYSDGQPASTIYPSLCEFDI